MLQDFPLRVGLSMEVTVDTRQNKGSMTPQARVFYDPRFSTDIYAEEEAGGYELIEKTIQANLPPFTKELEQNDS
jgi:hypothetical protein